MRIFEREKKKMEKTESLRVLMSRHYGSGLQALEESGAR